MANALRETVRGMDSIPIPDIMLNKREVFMMGPVDSRSCSEIMKELMYLDSEEPGKEITLYINSPGGNVQDGLAVYDLIMLLESPVRTVCMGTCASMGAILFLAGENPDKRIVCSSCC